MGSKRDKLKRAVRKTVKWGGLVVALSFVPAALGAGGRQPVHTTEYWVSALACLALAAVAWWADWKSHRRFRVGLCPACGYDRAGLAAGAVCPECGKQPEAR